MREHNRSPQQPAKDRAIVGITHPGVRKIIQKAAKCLPAQT